MEKKMIAFKSYFYPEQIDEMKKRKDKFHIGIAQQIRLYVDQGLGFDPLGKK